MSNRLRVVACVPAIALLLCSAGCAVAPKSQLIACQRFNCDLRKKHQELLAQSQGLRQSNQDLADRNQKLQEQLGSLEQVRDKVATAYGDLINQTPSGPLPSEVQQRLDEFARKYPELVEADPEQGISKFQSDVLFRSGEAVLWPESQQALAEFAGILRDPGAEHLRIMIVGHTDIQPIKKDATRTLHPTNWELSAHRAVAVTRFLQETGVDPQRIGGAFYSQFQPVQPGNSADALARNRRVEIYVLAPDVPVVGRTDGPSRY